MGDTDVRESEAKRTELLGQLKETGYKIEDTPEFKGLITDKQSEVKRRQDSESEVQRLTGEITRLSGELEAKETPPPDDEKLTDESLVTVGQVKKFLSTAKVDADKSGKANADAELRQRFIASETKAKTELTADKCGEGLDYASVLEGYKKMIQTNPGYQTVMLNDPEPAMAAYRIGLLEPEIAKRVKTRENVTLLDELTKGGKTPKVSGAAQVDIDQKSYEELLATPVSDLEKAVVAAESGNKE